MHCPACKLAGLHYEDTCWGLWLYLGDRPHFCVPWRRYRAVRAFWAGLYGENRNRKAA